MLHRYMKIASDEGEIQFWKELYAKTFVRLALIASRIVPEIIWVTFYWNKIFKAIINPFTANPR
jgi:hypothetical protein